MGRFSLRKLVLALVFAGILGLGAELLLLEHIESWTQWIPLVVLAGGLLSTVAVVISSGPASIAVFKLAMAAFVVAGLAGLYLHYTGNMEFALERNPNLSGFGLFSKAISGATPALAPAALTQLGLLGLAYAYSGSSRSGTEAETVE